MDSLIFYAFSCYFYYLIFWLVLCFVHHRLVSRYIYATTIIITIQIIIIQFLTFFLIFYAYFLEHTKLNSHCKDFCFVLYLSHGVNEHTFINQQSHWFSSMLSAYSKCYLVLTLSVWPGWFLLMVSSCAPG